MPHRLALGIVIVCIGSVFADAPATQSDAPGTRISLRLTGVSPEVAFQKLSEQAHLTLRPSTADFWSDSEDRRITASFENAPYWEVFAALATKASVVPFWWENGVMAIGHDEGAWSHQASALAGPLRVTVPSAVAHRSVLIGRVPSRVRVAAVSLEVAADPNAAVSVLSKFKVSALDQKGRPIAAELAGFSDHADFGRGRASIEIKFPTAGEEVTAIGLLKASFSATLSKVESIEIPNIRQANNVQREVGGAKVSISFHDGANGGFSIDLQADSKTADPATWAGFGRAITAGSVRLLDASGNVLPASGGSGRMARTQIQRTINYRSSTGGPPEKLVWDVPVALRDFPVAVEFKDLLLP